MAVRQLDEKYRTVVTRLIAVLRGEADAVLQGNHALETMEHFGITETGFSATHEGFSRQKIEGEYQKLYDTKALTVSDATSLVTQSDVLAGMEKAYQLRHRRRLGCLVSGTSRAHGQASPKGFAVYAMMTIPVVGGTNA